MSKDIKLTANHIRQFEACGAAIRKEAEQIKKNFFAPGIKVLGVSGSARDEGDMAQEASTTEWLLMKSLDEAKRQGAETKLLQLRKHEIKPCKACYSTTNTQCQFKCSCFPEGQEGDDMTNKIYDLMTWADVVIFATPVNNFKVSSLMALFIDRLISMDGSLIPADPDAPKDKDLNKLHTKYVEEHATDKFGSGFLKRMAGKVGGIIVSGHEAGASLTISSLYMTLTHYGFLFPPFSNMYAMGTIRNSTDKDKDDLEGQSYEKDARLLSKNLITAAKVLKRKDDYWWVYDGGIN